MTQVDFYILSSEAIAERLQFACKLTQKVYRMGHRVYIHTADQAGAEQFNQLLWQFSPSSFVPHALQGQADNEGVTIGWSDNPGESHDVMINLDLSVPGFVGRFERVAEVVVQDPLVRDPLRNSWKFYKDRGYPINRNNL